MCVWYYPEIQLEGRQDFAEPDIPSLMVKN